MADEYGGCASATFAALNTLDLDFVDVSWRPYEFVGEDTDRPCAACGRRYADAIHEPRSAS